MLTIGSRNIPIEPINLSRAMFERERFIQKTVFIIKTDKLPPLTGLSTNTIVPNASLLEIHVEAHRHTVDTHTCEKEKQYPNHEVFHRLPRSWMTESPVYIFFSQCETIFNQAIREVQPNAPDNDIDIPFNKTSDVFWIRNHAILRSRQ